MRRWLLVLTVVVGLGLTLAVWLGAEDARQADLLDAHIQAADTHLTLLLQRERQLIRDGEREDKCLQTYQEEQEAWKELQTLRSERWRRQQSWPARLRRQVRRRTGW